MNGALKEAIGKADVVSFDIFDTLIVRLYSNPTDLFRHLEETNCVDGFYNARISGEQSARRKSALKGISEVTLDQIYDEMHNSFLGLKDAEIELEKFVCRQNPKMKEVFDYCLEVNKRILITSDMYLPVEVIKEILINAGYENYEALFLSSEKLKQKATGELYYEVLKYAKTDGKRILHIGDNQYGDYEVALDSGLEAYLYVPIKDTYGNFKNAAFFATLNSYSDVSIIPSLMEGLITARDTTSNEDDYWMSFGYKYAGILAYSYARWLKKQFDKEGIEKAYFMLRDGYIFKKVFDYLYPDFQTYEIYGSRTMFMLPCANVYADIQKHITGEHPEGLTYRRAYERMAIDSDELYDNFISRYGDCLDQNISKSYEIQDLDAFFIENEKIIIDAASQERKTTIEYFDSIGLLEGKSAVVDLGWKGSMLKGINKICKLENRHTEIYGYFIGTHKFETDGIRALGFALNNGKPDNKYPNKALLDYSFTIAILELMFSAPHPSILKLEKKEASFSPIFQNVCSDEQKRINISTDILSGVIDFVNDFDLVFKQYPIDISSEMALIPLEYFCKNISKYDEMQIANVKYFPGVGNDNFGFPILKNGLLKFGVVLTWPGAMSAEAEVVFRLKKSASELGMKCIPIDNYGHILDENLKVIDANLFLEKPDFVIVTHYESNKMIDAFHYHTLWNPPEIPLNVTYYNERVTSNYIMCDDFLVYDKGGMSNHLQTMLINSPRTVEHALPFMASFPESALLEPDLSNPKIFYCGMNWEKVVNGGSRHQGLFKLLDDAEAIRIYGPDVVEEWGGIRPWGEYKCYQHPIPFDGFSLLKELNKCGICLVISSDIHRRAGAVTNRAFEACAAGAVMISDDNPLMHEMFGDAALFVNYNKNNPQDTFEQIMEKYNWILKHPDEALVLVERAQNIFRQKYSMDYYLKNLSNRHIDRFNTVANDLYAKGSDKRVMVTYVCNTLSFEVAFDALKQVINNINNQYYNNIILVVAADTSIANRLREDIAKEATNVKIFAMHLFDACAARNLTDGQAIGKLRDTIPHDYYVNTCADETWFFDHITTLIRAIEDSCAEGSYSGQIFLDCNGYKTVKRFESINKKTMSEFFLETEDIRKHEKKFIYPGAFMYKSSAHEYVPDYLISCFDGGEHIAYLYLLKYKYQKNVVFTKRMTFQFDDKYMDLRNVIVPRSHEQKLIYDFTKYELEIDFYDTTGNNLDGVSLTSLPVKKNDVLEVISTLPLKPYLRLRYYRIRLRHVDSSSKKGQKLSKKYEKALSDYKRFAGL